MLTTAAITEFAETVTAHDGVPPFNEATLLNLDSREQRAVFADLETPVALALGQQLADGRSEWEFAVLPEYRGRGYGAELLQQLRDPAGFVVWAHGDLPAARALAAEQGLTKTRTLFRLLAPLGEYDAEEINAKLRQAGLRIRAFDPERDSEAWVSLNARVFASHPEQGSLTTRDLEARLAQPWADPSAFLVLETPAGELVGYNWLKLAGDTAEIYVLGVSPDYAGKGLGKLLMFAGMNELVTRGFSEVELYVDGDNTAAVSLYRSLGFETAAVDSQYAG